jgi:hypothetical protein
MSSLGQKFEFLVGTILRALSFNITKIDSKPKNNQYSPDFRLKIADYTTDCEVKFYRSDHIPSPVIKRAAQLLAEHSSITDTHKILIVSCLVPEQLKSELSGSYNIIVWDRSNLFSFLKKTRRDDLVENFTALLTEAQQGSEAVYPFDNIVTTDSSVLSYFSDSFDPSIFSKPEIGQQSHRLGDVALGKDGWKEFEKKCVEILKYLFESDLSLWNEQQITDDKLSRFDMLCRVTSQDDFWRTLVNSFSSRYVLFEFKNFTDKISQQQIYLTERYLYPRALRSTAFIIARNGANEGAVAAAKGALREHGKLILLLSQNDLEEMIKLKDNGNSPSDYLSDLLDQHLVFLSR